MIENISDPFSIEVARRWARMNSGTPMWGSPDAPMVCGANVLLELDQTVTALRRALKVAAVQLKDNTAAMIAAVAQIGSDQVEINRKEAVIKKLLSEKVAEKAAHTKAETLAFTEFGERRVHRSLCC